MKEGQFQKVLGLIREIDKGYIQDWKNSPNRSNWNPDKRFSNPTKKQYIKHLFKIIEQIKKANEEIGDRKIRILDIGIGDGYMAAAICNLFDCEYHAAEHPDAEHTQYNTFVNVVDKYKIKVSYADITKQDLQYEPGYFDIILFTEVLEHLHQTYLGKVFHNIRNVLGKKGVLIITTPNLMSLVHRVKFFWGIPLDLDLGIAPTKGGCYGHIREYAVGELKQLLESYNFSVREIIMSNLSYSSKIVTFVNNIIGGVFSSLRNNVIVIGKKN